MLCSMLVVGVVTTSLRRSNALGPGFPGVDHAFGFVEGVERVCAVSEKECDARSLEGGVVLVEEEAPFVPFVPFEGAII